MQGRQYAEAEARAAEADEKFDPDDVSTVDVYEYWAVTDRGMRLLRQAGEQVMEYGLTYIWFRCTTGQAIYLDACIYDIVKTMEKEGL